MCVFASWSLLLGVLKWALARAVIVKASSGPRYVVSYRPTLPVAKLKMGTRVSLDMTTLTIMRILPREVDPMVYKMSLEDPGGATFAGIGGLGEQVRELREVRTPSVTMPFRVVPADTIPRGQPPRGCVWVTHGVQLELSHRLRQVPLQSERHALPSNGETHSLCRSSSSR